MRIENYSKSKLDPNLEETIKVFDDNKIKYWACHGTLLGLIRDQNLIPWDHDIDIAVWYSKNLKERIKKLMIENNYLIKEKYMIEDDWLTFLKEGGREVDINFYQIKQVTSVEKIAFLKCFVPKNNFCKLVDALSLANKYNGKFRYFIRSFIFIQPLFKELKKFLINKKYFYKTIGYTQPFKLLENFTKIEFKNIFISVPVLYEEYLHYVYGKNWKLPNKEFNWIKDSPSTKDL